jgi:hypothetical protein
MLVRSYEEMLKEYNLEDLLSDDKEDRARLLTEYKNSVIFEGDFLEFDKLNDWIKLNLGVQAPPFLFYGKLGYDYGFFELFPATEKQVMRLIEIIPELFTIFPNGKTMKTCGLDNFIELHGAT